MDVPALFPGHGFLISRPDPFAKISGGFNIFKDQKSEMIRCMALKWSFLKILQNEKTSPENCFSVNSGGFLKFPCSSQALELFMGDSGT